MTSITRTLGACLGPIWKLAPVPETARTSGLAADGGG